MASEEIEDPWDLPPSPTGPEPLHATEAEQTLISSLILSPELIPQAQTLQPRHFFNYAHGLIFQHIRTTPELDSVTIAHALRQANQLNAIGGTPYIGELLTAPHTTAIEHYCKIIRDLYIARETAAALEHTASKIRNNTPTLEAMNELRERLKEIKR